MSELTTISVSNLTKVQYNPLEQISSFSHPLVINLENESKEEYEQRQEFWLNKRFDLLSRAKHDTELQQVIRYWCKINPLFFINLTSVAFNPLDGGMIPLVLFNRQVQAILAMNLAERTDSYLTINKSRYVGASVFSTAYLVHSLLFKKDWTALLISRVLTLVDGSGDADTLFSKIDLAVDYLPPWLKPNLQRKQGLIRNHDMNSAIKGAGGKNAGRGGRASVVVVDEAAFVDNAPSVFAALSQTTKCIIFISTPNGRNEFYRLCSNKNIPNFRYHWTSDPRRDEVWYKDMCGKFPPHIIAQELDLSFDGSTENALIDAYKLDPCILYSDKIESSEHDETVAGLDIAGGGNNSSVIAIRQGRKLVAIKPLDKDLSLPQQARFVHQLCIDLKIQKLIFDSSGLGLGFKGCIDELNDNSYTVVAFLGNNKASDRITPSGDPATKLYANARSEAYHLLQDAINYTYNLTQGKIPTELVDESRVIGLVNCPELLQDLTKPQTLLNTTGKLLIESKQSMAKRGVSSPDYGDALAYCFYEGVNPAHDTSWLE